MAWLRDSPGDFFSGKLADPSSKQHSRMFPIPFFGGLRDRMFGHVMVVKTWWLLDHVHKNQPESGYAHLAPLILIHDPYGMFEPRLAGRDVNRILEESTRRAEESLINQHELHYKVGPQLLAKLVNMTRVTTGYGRYSYSQMAYWPTCNWRVAHLSGLFGLLL